MAKIFYEYLLNYVSIKSDFSEKISTCLSGFCHIKLGWRIEMINQKMQNMLTFIILSIRVSQKNLIFEFDHGVEFEHTIKKKLGISMHFLQSAARFCDFLTRRKKIVQIMSFMVFKSTGLDSRFQRKNWF